MTKADQIRKMDDSTLADELCYLTSTKDKDGKTICRFGGNCDPNIECAALKYLQEEVTDETDRR